MFQQTQALNLHKQLSALMRVYIFQKHIALPYSILYTYTKIGKKTEY